MYEYTAAFVGLGALSVGIAGLLWMFGDLITSTPDTVGAAWWRDRLSLFATLSIVALPFWILHWPARQTGTAHSTVRRIYLFVVLTLGVLALLGSGAASVYRVLALALRSSDVNTGMADLTHAAAMAVVAAAVVAYHWRMVRLDMRAVRAESEAISSPNGVVTQVVELRAPTVAALEAALESLQQSGITVHRRTA